MKRKKYILSVFSIFGGIVNRMIRKESEMVVLASSIYTKKNGKIILRGLSPRRKSQISNLFSDKLKVFLIVDHSMQNCKMLELDPKFFGH